MPNKGYKFSEESKKKISKALRGKKHSEETRKKISESHKGIKHSEETKRKLSKLHRGKRLSKEHKQKISLAVKKEKNGRWLGGISFTPYTLDWTITLRISIRERDKYICQLCKEKQGDISLDVHHIDYNKKNNNPNNLISLCRSCHMKTNTKRNYWINYFKNIYE